MKQSKAAVMLWGVAGLLGLVTGFGYYWQNYQSSHFVCQSDLVIASDTITLTLLSSFAFNGEYGEYHATGSLKQLTQPPISVNRAFRFNYLFNQGQLLMISAENSTHSSSLEHITQLVPDFFLYRNRGVELQLSRLNRSSYLFSQNNTPYIYCQKLPRTGNG